MAACSPGSCARSARSFRSRTGGCRVESAIAAALGDSVAIDGVCLTVTDGDGETLAFDAVPETLARTTLGRLGPGAEVNLEPALRAGEPLGGHFVQGHVDGVGRVRSRRARGRRARVWLELAPELLRYCVEKGSIAVDGVSLTIAALDDDGVRGRARPAHARGDTTLGALAPGDEVNLEVDVLAKYAERLARRGYDLRDGRRTDRATAFATIEEAIEDIRHGKFVVVVDAADRENEGDLDDRRPVRDARGDQLHGHARRAG